MPTPPANEALRLAVVAGPYATAASGLVRAAHLESGRLVKAGRPARRREAIRASWKRADL